MDVYLHILEGKTTGENVLCSLIHQAFPCHGLLALSTAGFVPLFAVHFTRSASFTCPNVCSVHFAVSTCSAPSADVSRSRKCDGLYLQPKAVAAGCKPDPGAK
ncbi:hypothetical protein GOODEAATRI_017437 [Goodea atripinnis]|uniref:Uncharacterized protein n=1 Tax=Goodea atripinnis TaxID=208336 RepID=A0ABV0PQ27_9TELE